jgi:hypothetical protein
LRITVVPTVCSNMDCSYICDFQRPIGTTIHAEDKHAYKRMTDYAVHVLYVLGFISVGDGCTEAGRLLGLLGLPNDTTMANRSFGIIEQRIGTFVQMLCDEIIVSNMEEEAKLSMNELDFNVWKMWKEDDSLGSMPVDRMPQIDASYDMAGLATKGIWSSVQLPIRAWQFVRSLQPEDHWVGCQVEALQFL